MNNVVETTDERLGLPSASNSFRRRNCPGSRAIVPHAPKPKTAVIAEDGTKIHHALETGDFSELEDDLREVAQQLWNLAEVCLNEWRTVLPLQQGSEITDHREERLWVTNPNTGVKMESAKLDRVWIFGEFALILDYKSGFLQTAPSPRNYQLRVQALAVKQNFPQVKHIRVAIAHYRLKSVLDTCDYTDEDLVYAMQDMLLSDWQSQQPDAPIIPGEWCRYCPASQGGICRQASVYAMIPGHMASFDFTGPDGTEYIAERLNTLPVDSLAFIHARTSIVTKILEGVKERLKSQDEATLESVGLALTPPSEIDAVEKVQELFNRLYTHNLITVEEFYKICDVSIGSLEDTCLKRFKEENGIKTDKEAKPKFRDFLRPVLTKEPRAGRLVQMTDKIRSERAVKKLKEEGKL